MDDERVWEKLRQAMLVLVGNGTLERKRT